MKTPALIPWFQDTRRRKSGSVMRRARQLGLALYEGVPLRTLKTLIPTRRLRVRPLDAARFDVVTSATFVLLLAAQRLPVL